MAIPYRTRIEWNEFITRASIAACGQRAGPEAQKTTSVQATADCMLADESFQDGGIRNLTKEQVRSFAAGVLRLLRIEGGEEVGREVMLPIECEKFFEELGRLFTLPLLGGRDGSLQQSTSLIAHLDPPPSTRTHISELPGYELVTEQGAGAMSRRGVLGFSGKPKLHIACQQPGRSLTPSNYNALRSHPEGARNAACLIRCRDVRILSV